MRVVLVTGGSSGIGAATVRRFAAAGDQVAFTYLHSETSARQVSKDTSAMAIRADAASSKDMNAAVKQILRDFGRIDVLVCNAGIASKGLLMDASDDEYRRIMDTNVFGTFCAMRAVLPDMVEKRSGSIVTISSMWGQVGGACEALYSASKGAIIALTRATAQEVGSAGIRVNCVAPGVIDTRMNGNLSAEDLAQLGDETPLGRIGTAEEIAETVFYLAGNGASFITGQVVGVNGGFVI